MKKRNTKLGLVLGLGFLLGLGTYTPVWASGFEMHNLEVSGDADSGYISLEDDVEETENYESSMGMLRAGSLPSSYNSRPYSLQYVTSVKNQGSNGLCWSYSAMAALESNLMITGQAGSSTDLSEGHLAYNTFYGTNQDSSDGTRNETYSAERGTWTSVGGNRILTTGTLARWYGAVNESRYGGSSQLGNPGAVEQKAQDVRLVNSLWLPEITRYSSTADMTGEFREWALNNVKQAIMEYGGVEVGFYAGTPTTGRNQSSARGQDMEVLQESEESWSEQSGLLSSGFAAEDTDTAETGAEENTGDASGEGGFAAEEESMDFQNTDAEEEFEAVDPEEETSLNSASANVYYSSVRRTPNHSVLLVGWDDSKETGASEPGAFLFKNSWGTSSGDNGYYWISYYDKSMRYPTVYEGELSDSEDTTISNQLDGTGYGSYISAGSNGSMAGANVFTASQDQYLKQVAIYAPANGLEYEVKIYKNVEDDPSSGVLTDTICGSLDYAGYYTLDLSEQVPIKAGEKFAVALEYTNAGSNGYIPHEPVSGTAMSSGNSLVRATTSFEEGQSYLYSGDDKCWYDMADLGAGFTCNLNIKAYGTPAENLPSQVVFIKNPSGTKYTTAVVEYGETVPQPVDPSTISDNWVFLGWYTDEKCTKAYDFSQPVTGNMRLYAKWGRWYEYSNGTKWKYRTDYYNSRDIAEDECITINGKTFCFDSDGYCYKNWMKVDGRWYFMKLGDSPSSFKGAYKGWGTIQGKKFYFNSLGQAVYGKRTINGKMYYLGTNTKMGCYMHTNYWLTNTKGKYYFGSNGVIYKGLKKIGSKWYYFDDTGLMQTGWETPDDGIKRYFGSNGAMYTGKKKVGSYYYYFESNGAIHKGWQKISSKWYYFNSSGHMVTGKYKIGGVTYTFNSDGSLRGNR